jgi:hypothetical protein
VRVTALRLVHVDHESGTVEYQPAIATVTVPVRTVSELNRHEHWRLRQKRAKGQHLAVRDGMLSSALNRYEAWSRMGRGSTETPRLLLLPLHVHLTRLATRKLDTDNLAGALKHVRDAVAKFLGVDDGDESKVTWSVGQEPQKGYAVRVEFYRRRKE